MLRLTLIALAVAAAGVTFQTQAAPNGEQLYTRHCAVCHNDEGIGGIGLPLNGDKIEHFPRDYLFKTIRHGRIGRVMPAFEELSDAQVNAIVEYILSWKKSRLPAEFSARLVSGDRTRGKDLFIQHCSECHGEDGRSEGLGTGVTMSRERRFNVVPPALNNPGFLASASDSWIQYTIQNGRPGTEMPSQSKLELSDQDVNDIVSHIRGYESRYPSTEEQPEDPPTLVFESPYDFTTTVSNIKQSLQGMNFRYFPDRYLEMGLADDSLVNKRQLSLRFCNFNQLYRILNIEPRLGVVLPCRLTVVEDAEGQVRIYAMNMQLVSRLFNNTQLNEAAEQMHENILEVIEEATL